MVFKDSALFIEYIILVKALHQPDDDYRANILVFSVNTISRIKV
jgi:hypothetical protein